MCTVHCLLCRAQCTVLCALCGRVVHLALNGLYLATNHVLNIWALRTPQLSVMLHRDIKGRISSVRLPNFVQELLPRVVTSRSAPSSIDLRHRWLNLGNADLCVAPISGYVRVKAWLQDDPRLVQCIDLRFRQP